MNTFFTEKNCFFPESKIEQSNHVFHLWSAKMKKVYYCSNINVKRKQLSIFGQCYIKPGDMGESQF